VVVQPNGDLVVLGWSDGGNSVFTRQPTDWRKGLTSRSALGMEAWGMKGANSLAYLMVIDGKTFEQKAWTLWLAFIPDNFENAKNRGAPNFASITALRSLADGSIGFHGATATGLIQTPNALYKPPTDGRRFGGNFVAVMTPEMNDLLFSTHLPGCENISLGSTKRGMLVVSRSAGKDHAQEPQPSPLIKPLQAECKGEFDAHILLLDLPASRLQNLKK
jgi:hypothetical protein